MRLTKTTTILKADRAERTVVARISTTSVDREGDVLLPSGADLTDFNKNPVVLFGHNAGGMPIGKAENITRQRDALLAEVKFAERPETHPDGAEWVPDTVHELFKQGILRAFSVGFTIPEGGARPANEKDLARFGEKARRIVSAWKLLEFSVVPIPANQDALALAVSKGWLTRDSQVFDCLDGEADKMQQEPLPYRLQLRGITRLTVPTARR
jgi:HK97 family phage prohead protease